MQKMNCFPKHRIAPYTGRTALSQLSAGCTTNREAGPGAAALKSGERSHYQRQHCGSNASAATYSQVTGSNLTSSCGNDLDLNVDNDVSHASIFSNTSTGSLNNSSTLLNTSISGRNDSGLGGELQKKVMLQLNNLDSSYDEASLKSFLVSLMKPITPIVSLVIDGSSSAKIEVPSHNVRNTGSVV